MPNIADRRSLINKIKPPVSGRISQALKIVEIEELTQANTTQVTATETHKHRHRHRHNNKQNLINQDPLSTFKAYSFENILTNPSKEPIKVVEAFKRQVSAETHLMALECDFKKSNEAFKKDVSSQTQTDYRPTEKDKKNIHYVNIQETIAKIIELTTKDPTLQIEDSDINKLIDEKKTQNIKSSEQGHSF